MSVVDSNGYLQQKFGAMGQIPWEEIVQAESGHVVQV